MAKEEAEKAKTHNEMWAVVDMFYENADRFKNDKDEVKRLYGSIKSSNFDLILLRANSFYHYAGF